MAMGIVGNSQFSPLAMQMVKAALAAGPDGARKIIQRYQVSNDPQEKLAAFIAGPMVERELMAVTRHQAIQGYRPQPTVLDQMGAPDTLGVAGLPTEESYGETLHAAGGGIIAFSDAGLVPPSDMVEQTARTADEADDVAKVRERAARLRAAQAAKAAGSAPAAAGLASIDPADMVEQTSREAKKLPTHRRIGQMPPAAPSTPSPKVPGGVVRPLGVAGLAGYGLGELVKPLAESSGLTGAVTDQMVKLSPNPIFAREEESRKPVKMTKPSTAKGSNEDARDAMARNAPASDRTAYDKVAEINQRTPRAPSNLQVLEGGELLAGLTDKARATVLSGGPGEYDLDLSGAETRDGKPVKGKLVLGEPNQETAPPTRTIAKPAAESEGMRLARDARDMASRLLEGAQQAGPPKTMGHYVGDVKSALKEAGVSEDAGTEAEARARANLARVDDDKRFALGMSIAKAGFAAAAAKSPYALANIAEGFGIGVDQYTKSISDIRKAQREEEKALADIEAARRGEKLKIGTAAYEQRQKDIDNATKRLEDARRLQATVYATLANVVLDKESADLRTGAMLDQNTLTRMNNAELKLQAEKMGLVKEIGDRVAEITKGMMMPPTPQQRAEIERQVAVEVMGRAKALGVKSAENYTAPAPAAPAGIPGAKVVGVR